MNWRVGNRRVLIVGSVIYWIVALLETMGVVEHHQKAAWDAMWHEGLINSPSELEKIGHIANQEGWGWGLMALLGFGVLYVLILAAYWAALWITRGYRTA